MSTVDSLTTHAPNQWFEPDRVGVFASVLCAIHCALTPILLLMLPTFGRVWSHPASHWGMALFVVPVAAFTLTRGFRRHRRRWVVGVGVLGMALVVAGAAVPYIGESQAPDGGNETSLTPELAVANVSEGDIATAGENEESGLSECGNAGVETEGAECEDLCCPTLQASADGGWKLHIPLASIITTLGGLSLIVTHFGNLCCSSACAKQILTK